MYTDTHLVEVVHEHLSHLVDGNGGVDGTLESKCPHQVGQSAQMNHVRMGHQDSIDLFDVPVEAHRRPGGREHRGTRHTSHSGANTHTLGTEGCMGTTYMYMWPVSRVTR